MTTTTETEQQWAATTRYGDEHAGEFEEARVPLTETELELLKLKHTTATLKLVERAMFGERGAK